jgi:hypothetical protein
VAFHGTTDGIKAVFTQYGLIAKEGDTLFSIAPARAGAALAVYSRILSLAKRPPPLDPDELERTQASVLDPRVRMRSERPPSTTQTSKWRQPDPLVNPRTSFRKVSILGK